MAGYEEEQRDWMNLGARKNREVFIRNYVQQEEKKKEVNLRDRRIRLRELFRREEEWETVRMNDNLREKQNIFVRHEIDTREIPIIRSDEEINLLNKSKKILERDRCPYYRDCLSKEISSTINAQRQQEIILKKALKPHIN